MQETNNGKKKSCAEGVLCWGIATCHYAYWFLLLLSPQAVEVTIQNLIGAGMDPKTENSPYLGFIYTSFQERATKVSHGNTAAHASQLGDKQLGRICAAIAGDEARHEKAYIKIVDELFRLCALTAPCSLDRGWCCPVSCKVQVHALDTVEWHAALQRRCP
jgi:hypothetical protein